jgi:uncharacterized protein YbcI
LQATPLVSGQLLTAISTSIVAIVRDHYGRGPMKAKTYLLDDMIIVVMRGSGSTAPSRRFWTAASPTAWSPA